ncbi:hypothetical protein [Asanoa sp. NPDC050611]|uniref:hypothetical protein n=1 Tax=Asanoa sp. NPDC050611 TaxID=3157098 RepID=UPI0033F0A4E4
MAFVSALIVLVVLIAGGLTFRAKRRRRDPLAAEHHAELKVARKGLREAEKARNDAIRNAQRSLRSAERAHAKQVRQAQSALSEVTNPDGKRIGSYGGVKLHELAVHTPNGRGDLIGASATVDTAGNLVLSKRPTLTRMAAGGLLLGPLGALGSLAFQKTKKHDARELYLLIETPDLASVVKCPADEGLKARSFAAKINTAAKQAEAIAAARPGQIQEARKTLASAEADTAAVESARAELAQVEGDTVLSEHVEVAQARLLALEAARPSGQLALPAPATDDGPAKSGDASP